MGQALAHGRVLLTGATGYVGGRMLPLLQERGSPVRVMVRRPEQFTDHAPGTEVVFGDVLESRSLDAALADVDTAYYLIHSMGEKRGYAQRDSNGAQNFAAAARRAGLRRIIYLGGLGRGEDLSQHLRSRQEVGQILKASGVETIELRASIIIGSGSLSFELVRSLVERLPVMVTPRWVKSPAQPIAIEDLLAYLTGALDLPPGSSRIFEVGGAEQTSYLGLMQEYARQRGLRRVFVPVPVLSPGLSSLWLGLVTPLFARIGSKLIESVRNSTLVEDKSAQWGLRCPAPRGGRSHRAGPGQGRPGLRANPLVRRPVLGGRQAALWWRPAGVQAGGQPRGGGPGPAGRGLRAHPPDRRPNGLVFR